MNFPGTTPAVGGAAAPPAVGGPQDPNVKAVRLFFFLNAQLSLQQAHVLIVRKYRSKLRWSLVLENRSCLE